MTLIELTDIDGKIIVNFNYVIRISKLHEAAGPYKTVLILSCDTATIRSLPVYESKEQIEKLLNEVGVFIKRAYEPKLENLSIPNTICSSNSEESIGEQS